MKRTVATLERVLNDAESLPAEEQAMLEVLLHKRRIERWRQEAALASRNATKAFRAGKLKAQLVKAVIDQLRTVK